MCKLSFYQTQKGIMWRGTQQRERGKGGGRAQGARSVQNCLFSAAIGHKSMGSICTYMYKYIDASADEGSPKRAE